MATINDQLQYETVEFKGLGEEIEEFPSSVCGSKIQYGKYAGLITNGHPSDPGFNVMIMENSFANPNPSKKHVGLIYLFANMVSEEEARKAYDRLR